MDDQFGGRTDDDLFYDDLEPVQSPAVLVQESQPTAESKSTAAQTAPSSQSAPSKTPQSTSTGLSASRFAPKPSTATTPSPKPAPTPPPNAPTAPKEKGPRQQQGNRGKNGGVLDSNNSNNHNNNQPNGGASDEKPAANAANASRARLTSGANPRTKLTDEELAARMEKMKLVSAEKARKFEAAQTDEKQHAAAYAKGMEEARKRRAEEAERRKQGEVDRRKMDDEREKNRERKLKAMGMKEGGWDEGKSEREEEEARRGFRGANGGIRGTRRGGGTLYPTKDVDGSEERPSFERGGRGRGRGRGARGGGRGGQRGSPKIQASKGQQNFPSTEDFPSLPSGKAPTKEERPEVTTVPDLKTNGSLEQQLPPPSKGRWDDEMEEMDAMKHAQGTK